MTTEAIWVIDDDKSIRWVLEKALKQAGMNVTVFDRADGVLEALRTQQPAAILSDIRMPGMSGLELLAKVHKQYPQLPVIIMTAHSDLDSAVQSYQGGAFEYLPKPFDLDDAISLVQRALTHAREQMLPRTSPSQGGGTRTGQAETGIIGEAPAMQEVFRAIGRLAQSPITVLINGESGTGKELVARALHRHSPRASKPFIALNMAAIPRDLIESELFGHEKGAFTNASSQRQGRFEQAAGGTLFLDEIGDMPLEAQTRLLRVLSDGSFFRVGGHTAIQADVRIIAATHQHLESLVRNGLFREDLFHRLNVIRIQLPKLSERRQDIPQLARFFLQKAARELNIEARTLLPETEQFLSQLEWPGNVRQLENTCRWITVMAASRDVMISDLPPELLSQPTQAPSLQAQSTPAPGGAVNLSSTTSTPTSHPTEAATSSSPDPANRWHSALAQWANQELYQGATNLLGRATLELERILIEATLQHTGGRRGEAAELLGWGRNTLTRKLKELGMEE
ncbi:Nitrogen assimilation response regulator [gamma proteobacterium HdN1]|nr:Nitrogen assimilation response regulator [gamma proteobacterium HdN1]